jgi:hypothetical protein
MHTQASLSTVAAVLLVCLVLVYTWLSLQHQYINLLAEAFTVYRITLSSSSTVLTAAVAYANANTHMN